MKQSGHLNPSEETGTGCPVTSKYGRTPPNKHGGVGRQHRDMGLYEVPLSMSLFGFGMGTILDNFHMCCIMLVLRAVFNMLVWNSSSRGPMCFRCLIQIQILN